MKRIISIITAVLLVLGSYSLCFADNSPYLIQYSETDRSSYKSEATAYTWVEKTGYQACYLEAFNLGSSPCYMFGYGTSSSWQAVLVVPDNTLEYVPEGVGYAYKRGSGKTAGANTWALTSYENISYHILSEMTYDTYYTPYIPFFDTLSAGLAFYNTSLSAPVVTSSYNLPCGNTIYIDLGSSGASYNLSFNATYNTKLGILNDTWPNSHYYVFANTIPQTTSAFTPSTGTYITMYKGGDRDLLGQTYKGTGSIEGTSTGRYLVIVNPLMYAKTTNIYNPVLSISGIPAGTTIYTYPVSSSIVGSEVMSEITSTAGGIGTASSSGGAITTYSTQDTEIVYTPNAGGNTVVDVHNYVDDAISSIEQTLSNFTQSVSGVLSAPIGHINQLISSGSNFFQHLSGLWSWLPSEVVATISGALSLVVTVAIFKVFL